MNFNVEQLNTISQFIKEYSINEAFKSEVENTYQKEVEKLSILTIYALEEILRYGNREIYQKFLKSINDNNLSQAVSLYDSLIELLQKDNTFYQYKKEQWLFYKETLSSLELFALSLWNEPMKHESSEQTKESTKEEKKEKLEYDPFTLILYKTDKQIRTTLENLFFGEFIHQMLQNSSMEEIRNRQIENGRIANQDKPYIILEIQKLLSNQKYMNEFKQVIDHRFVKVKMDILLGKEKEAFAPYLKFNTNISASEILKREENTIEEQMYNYVMEMIKKRNDNNSKKK